MSRSPVEETSANNAVNYVEAIHTLDRLIKSGKSLSGRERNCCFLNIGSERFANISAVSGLDFSDDGRAVAVVDWDHDGDLDLWISNRTGPKLRFLRNNAPTANQYVLLRLEGRQSNRDAIGARVEVVTKGEEQRVEGVGRREKSRGSGTEGNESENPKSEIRIPKKLIKSLHAGNGFVSQSSKWIHFGLPSGTQIERVVVHWPGGDQEEFTDVNAGGRYRLVQGSGLAEENPWSVGERAVQLTPSRLTAHQESAQLNVTLAARVPMTTIRYQNFDGGQVDVPREPGRPVLLNLWAGWCENCLTELSEFAVRKNELRVSGLNIVALSVDGLGDDRAADPAALSEQLARLNYPFAAGLADEQLVDQLELLYATLFNRQVSLPLPASFLIDAQGLLANIYMGPVKVERLLRDIENLSADDQQLRRLAAPFPGTWYTPPRHVELQQIASVYALAGYVADSIPLYRTILQRESNSASAHNLLGVSLFKQNDLENAKHHYREALRLNPEMVDARFNLGLLATRQEKTSEAIENYRAVIKMAPDYFDAQINLASVFRSLGQLEEATSHYREAARIQPHNLVVRRLLAVGLIQQGLPEEAVPHFRVAAELDHGTAETLNDLGAALLRAGQQAEAVNQFRRVLELRPGWKTVMNNLAWTLATSDDPELRDPADAVRLAEQLTRGIANPPHYALDTLAAAYAASGQYEKAVQMAEQAVRQATHENVDPESLNQVQDRLRLYQQHQPYREGGLSEK